MSQTNKFSRWYAYNARPDLLKPQVTIHDATVKRFEALFTTPPAPVFIPQKPACNVAPRSHAWAGMDPSRFDLWKGTESMFDKPAWEAA